MEWLSSLSLSYKLLVLGWVLVLIWVPYVIYTNKKHHPSALFVLFFAELWERFSYYGMRALLVLYMIDKGAELVYDKSHAYAIYGAYGAMVYATPLLGGLIAEKFFGYRKEKIEPRLHGLKYDRELHEQLEKNVMPKLKSGQPVAGKFLKKAAGKKKGDGFGKEKGEGKGDGSESQKQTWEFHELRPSEIHRKPER